jgi:hypothetical protein
LAVSQAIPVRIRLDRIGSRCLFLDRREAVAIEVLVGIGDPIAVRVRLERRVLGASLEDFEEVGQTVTVGVGAALIGADEPLKVVRKAVDVLVGTGLGNRGRGCRRRAGGRRGIGGRRTPEKNDERVDDLSQERERSTEIAEGRTHGLIQLRDLPR